MDNPCLVRHERRARLWGAAQAHMLSFLPGRGLDCVYKGARGGDPVCLAIYDWIQTIWDLYYERLDVLPDGDVPEDFFDFSTCGDMPAPSLEE